MNEYARYPGYVSVREAASILNCNEDRIWYYIRQKRLSARKIDGRNMVTDESVRDFHIRPRGRVRTNAVQWRVYRGGATAYALQIDISVRAGKQDEWREKLRIMLDEQEHLFVTTQVADG